MSVKFDKYDELFFDIILFNKTMFEDTMKKSLDYNLDITKEIMELKTTDIKVKHKGKTSNNMIILFGLYNKINKLFKWIGDSNYLLQNQLNRYDIKSIFGSQRTLDKIFKHEYIISEKYHEAIPYLMAILNPAFNLVSFATPDDSMYFYAFVNLGIKDNFIFEKFVSDMLRYRNALETEINTTKLSRKLIKKSKKKTSKKAKKGRVAT